MKILQVVPYFPPAYAFGGPVNVSYQISKELVKRGHEVVVYTTDAESLNSRLNIKPMKVVDGIRVHYMRNLSLVLARRSKLFITPEISLRAKEEIKEFDIVHLHEYRTYQNIIIHRCAKKYGVPYVLQAHGSLLRIMTKQRLKLIYDVLFGYRILRDASKVIALTKTEAQQYRSMGVAEEKIEIIPNGIDLSEFADLPLKGSFKKKFGIDEDEKIVLYLGRIHQIKGIDILVKAFAKVVKKLSNVKLVIVGPDDGYLGELKALIRALKIEDNVLLLGPLYGRDKLEVYVDAEVYVLPSRYETFPMSLLEAYACSKPVIASNVGGLKDLVINDVTGYLVEPRNIKQLAGNIFSLLNDDNKAKEIGLRGKKFVEKKYTIEKVVNVLEHLYEDVKRAYESF